jgi:hypothetical protein
VDTIKQIPQAFFDLIARVTPGIIAIMLFLYLSPEYSWKELLTWISAEKLSDKNVLGFAVLVFLVFGYAAGHAVAPFGKLIGKVPPLLGRHFGKCKCEIKEENARGDEDKTASEARPREDWRAYDWLRIHQPEVCKTPVRIRAEYTMHFS